MSQFDIAHALAAAALMLSACGGQTSASSVSVAAPPRAAASPTPATAGQATFIEFYSGT